MIPSAILDQTLQRFPRLDRTRLEIEPLEKGGSGRRYHRVSAPPCTDSVIVVTYTGQREENRHFCDIAAFLGHLGLRVPAIFHHQPMNGTGEGTIWVEDLGAIDLWHFRNEPWPRRRALYGKALEQAAILHTQGHRALAYTERPTFQKAFDAELYRWEQGYFFEQCVGRHFGLDRETLAERYNGAGRERLEEIAQFLAAKPRVLVHRDFQSQNVMILPDDQAGLIDFQGMRPGLGEYDLASLLYDPYVNLPEAERAVLAADYRQLLVKQSEQGEEALSPQADFDLTFDLCALQRLMQALGAYGFLGYEQGKPAFLQHIPVALPLLRGVVARIKGLDDLLRLLDDLLDDLERAP